MTPDRWQKINRVFQSALELKPEERDDFVREACGDDESLRGQVETLLAADERAGDFMSGNAAKDVGHLLEDNGPPDMNGKKIGHYEVLSLLGKGGMGKVYLARDSKLNRSVALKTLPHFLAGSEDYLKRFETEAKAAANLNHPNVATVYSVEETDDKRVFITMEFIEGKPLGDLIPDGGLDIRTFLDWFIPITDALSHAHDRGIVHRDIKPGNVMITNAGTPKILDFGLARVERANLADSASTLNLTKTGQVLGTPAYMSPEQAEGSQADRRSDIFSLGVLMYEALTGTKPFKGDNYASIISKLLTAEPRPVAETRSDVPYIISRVVMKCLRKEPRQRYQTMREVFAILKEVRSALDSGASLSEPARGLRTGFAAGRREIVLAGAAAVFLLSSMFFAWQWLNSGGAQTPPVVRFSVSPPVDQEIRLFEADLSRDGRLLVFATRSKGVRNLFVRSLERFELTPVPGTDDARFPFFSPDARWIGFFLEDGSLRKVPLEGGDALTICTSCKEASYGHWGTDGYIYASDEQGVFRISGEGGVPERLTKLDESSGDKSHRAPTLLPDEKGVLFSKVGKDTVSFAVLDIESGNLSIVENVEGEASTHGGISLARYVNTGHLVFSRAGQLFAVRFDPGELKAEGAPLPVVGGVFALPNFRIADNGTLAYLPEASMDENQLVWVNRNGETRTAVEKRGDFRSPKLSPDGLRIAVQLGGDIWIFEPDSGRSTRLTYEGKSQSPVWSPDGGSVLYASESDSVWKIFRKSADGAGDPEELYSGEAKLLPYSFHPNEPIVALASMPNPGQADIALLSLTDRSIRQLISTDFKEDSPRFSPDGERIAYFSMETGKVEVYIAPWREGSSARKSVVSTSGGIYPVWGEGGREIFYRSGRRLLAAEIGPGSEIRQPQVLFEGEFLTGFDASADGTRFLMVRNEDGTMPSTLNIVLNWTAELSRLMPAARGSR